MGFGGNSRREAKRQQEEALRLQFQREQEARQAYDQYRGGFQKRNEAIIGLRDRAQNFLTRLDSGADITTLIPEIALNNQRTADTVTNTYNAVSNLGNRAMVSGDKNYQAKLNSLAQRQVSRGLADTNTQALLGSIAQNKDTVFSTSQYLTGDERFGLGLYDNSFNMANTLFGNATTKREMEIARGNMMNQMLMSGISGGLTGFAQAGGFQGLGNLFRRSGSGGSAS